MEGGPLLLHGERRLPVPADGLSIGREEGNDIVLEGDDAVSRRHAVVRAVEGSLEVEDLSSTNGTIVEGEVLHGGRRLVAPGATIVVGATTLRCLGEAQTAVAEAAGEPVQAYRLVDVDRPVTLGRDASNDVVLAHPSVSRCHARLEPVDGGIEVVDLGSRNGTRVDGRPVRRAQLPPGSELAVGPFRILHEPDGLVASDEPGELAARGVALDAGGRRVLQPTDLTVRAGELVAVIGRSGSGKTSLVRCLAGVVEPSAGEVRLGGEPVRMRMPEVGYLPQDEIVHPQLTPLEALRYAARLRLPDDLEREEVDGLARRVLEELALEHRADTRIGRLSGGERKRAGLAVELLGQPGVLFLDEPTTGLDPGLEVRTMELLRRLADSGLAVVVVTHATRSVDLCDRLMVMAPGGRVAFLGRPEEALERFGVAELDEVYDAVEAATGTAPGPEPAPATPAPVAPSAPPRRSSAPAQLRALTARGAKVLSRDRRNVALLLAQVPLLGLAVGAIFGHDVFVRSRRGNPNDAAQVLFLLSTVAIWIGAIASVRELVKERAVAARERAVGVLTGVYVASKLLLLGGVVALQAAALTAIVLALRPLHETPAVYAQVGGLAVLTALAAVAMGLWLSSLARSQDQALSFIPLALVPQLLFAGALVPISKMGDVLQVASGAAFSRWSFAAMGSAVDLSGRLDDDPYDARYSPFERSAFDLAPIDGALILTAFAAAFSLLTLLAVHRRRA